MQFICLKEKKFHRSLSFCLVFFISFSVCFGFRSNKVKANPLIGVAESEVVSVIVNVLSAFGVVISIPTAKDFLDEEKEFANQKALELQNHKGAVTKGIQAIKEGYYVSKEFCLDVLEKWEDYRIKHNIKSTVLDNSMSINFEPALSFYKTNYLPSSKIDSYNSKCLASFMPYLPSNSDYLYIYISYDGYGFGDPCCRPTRASHPEWFGKTLTFSFLDDELYMLGQPIYSNVFRGFNGVKVAFGKYSTKPQVDKKVIDNVLEPVNSQNQGIVISPEQVESVGKVLDPSIPDVPNSAISNTAPISSVASTVPKVVSGADVGALPWGDVGSIDKPTDIPKDESKDIPKDESKDTPKDESKDTPKDEAGVDFSPFLTLGTGLKDVFPFCLPFDLIKNLHLLSAPPQAPHFDIDFKKAGLAGGDVVSIDFSQFELLAKIIRFFLTLGFIYFLIIKTRDMIRG